MIYIILKYAFWIFFPFIFGFMLAIIIRRIVHLLINVTGLKIREASLVLLVICYIMFFAALYLIISLLFKEGSRIASDLPQLYKNEIEPIFLDTINDSKIKNELISYLMTEFKSVASSFIIDISAKLANVAIEVSNIIISCMVAIIASFFFCLDYDKITSSISERFPHKYKKKLAVVIHGTIISIKKILKSALIILLITFIELLIGLSLLRVDKPILVALLISLADFLPLIGTGTILIPWAIISFIRGNSAFSIGIATIYLIITIIRNIIEPKIIGKNTGIHPLITLTSMYIGLKFGGVLLAFLIPTCLTLFKTIKNSNQT